MRTLFFALALTAAFLCIMTSGAQAQTSRLYMAGYMGLNLYSDRSFEDANGTNDSNFSLDNTASFAGALGLRISRNLRVEAEVSYRSANTDQISFDSGGSTDLNGQLAQSLALVNLYYDFDVPWEVKPFVSAGAGLGLYDAELEAPGFSYEDDTTSFTWTAGAGLKYRPRRDLAFTAGYRYLSAADLELEDFHMDYSSHELRIGIEYDLN